MAYDFSNSLFLKLFRARRGMEKIYMELGGCYEKNIFQFYPPQIGASNMCSRNRMQCFNNDKADSLRTMLLVCS